MICIKWLKLHLDGNSEKQMGSSNDDCVELEEMLSWGFLMVIWVMHGKCQTLVIILWGAQTMIALSLKKCLVGVF